MIATGVSFLINDESKGKRGWDGRASYILKSISGISENGGCNREKRKYSIAFQPRQIPRVPLTRVSRLHLFSPRICPIHVFLKEDKVTPFHIISVKAT